MSLRNAIQQYAVPVNTETGKPLTDMQLKRIEAISEATEPLYTAMHQADGSSMPGDHQEHIFTSRRMILAAEFLEIAIMLARKAALE